MTNALAHAAEAQRHIEWAHEWQEREGETEATALATVALAQAHATLALAEQQRIANLIALAQARGRGLGEQVAADALGALATFHVHENPDMGGWYDLRSEIARALGIEAPDGR